jgi:hypothetical protein
MRLISVFRSYALLIISVSTVLLLSMPLLTIPFIGRHAWNEGIYSAMINDLLYNSDVVPFGGMVKPDFGNPHLFQYLSTLPRLVVGQREYGFRLISLASNIVTLLVFSLICASLKGFSKLSPLLFATMPAFLFYGARSQPEALGLAFLALAFLFAHKARQAGDTNGKYLVAAGLSAGFSVYSKFEFVVVIPALLAILFLGVSKGGKLHAFKNLVIVSVIAILPYLFSVCMENVIYPQYLPYKLFFARFSLPGFIESSTSVAVASNVCDLVWTGFYALGASLILGVIAIFVYLFDVSVSKKARIPLMEGSIILLFLYTVISISELSHFRVHEYLFLPITVPCALLASYVLTRVNSISSSHLKKGYLIPTVIVLVSIIFGALVYNDFYIRPLGQEVPDGYGNIFAVNAGKSISRLTIRTKGIVLVQSDVIGTYTNHPYITWYDIWSLNFTRLQNLSLADTVRGAPLYETFNVFNLSTTSQQRTVATLSSLNLSALVISPEITDVITRSPALSGFVEQNFVKVSSFGPYTIMIAVRELVEKPGWNPVIDWRLTNVGLDGTASYSLNVTSPDTLEITSCSGVATHWFVDRWLSNPMNLTNGYMSFRWFGYDTGRYLHISIGNDYRNRRVYVVFDNQPGWRTFLIPLNQPAFSIGESDAANATLISIGDFGQGESLVGTFEIKDVNFWCELAGS